MDQRLSSDHAVQQFSARIPDRLDDLPIRIGGSIIEREGLRQISDTGSLEKIVDEAIANNSKQVEQYRSGKTAVIGYLVGQVMKASKGQANPAAVNELLKTKLQ